MKNHISNRSIDHNSHVEYDKYIEARKRIDDIAAKAKDRVEELKRLEQAVVEFRNAWALLNYEWEAIEESESMLGAGYPFKQSFDEIAVEHWVMTVKDSIATELNELA